MISSQPRQNAGPPNAMSVERAEPGAPVLSASPSGVSANRCASRFGEDAESGERPHEPMQRRCVRACDRGQFGRASSSVCQMVGDAQFRRRIDSRRHPSACAHLDQLHMGGDSSRSTRRRVLHRRSFARHAPSELMSCRVGIIVGSSITIADPRRRARWTSGRAHCACRPLWSSPTCCSGRTRQLPTSPEAPRGCGSCWRRVPGWRQGKASVRRAL